MTSVLRVDPDEVEPKVLDALGEALESVRMRLVPSRTPAQLVAPNGETLELPDEIFEVVVRVVEELSHGNGVSVASMDTVLSTTEAAELLNVSRPYLIKQLENGALRFHMAGTHRRMRLGDVLEYRDRLERDAENALSEMTQQAEELGLYKKP